MTRTICNDFGLEFIDLEPQQFIEEDLHYDIHMWVIWQREHYAGYEQGMKPDGSIRVCTTHEETIICPQNWIFA